MPRWILANRFRQINDWPDGAILVHSVWVLAAGSFLICGYATTVILWAQSEFLQHLQLGLQAVGRMAFSNYIGQSVIYHLLFYGTGLGMFGQLDLASVMLFPPLVWLLQITISTIWLRHYQFGPLEWLWRSLSYGQQLPLK